jgi:hypothetical protein
MTYCPSVHTSISRKGRKKKLDTKRNKRQCVDSEDGIALEILKQRRDSKRARTDAYVISQECDGGSSNDISSVEIYVSSQENNESSRSNINSMEDMTT